MTVWTAVALFCGLALGLLVGAFVARALCLARGEAAVGSLLAERDLLAAQVIRLEDSAGEQRDLAMTLAPLSSSLARVERQVEQLERERAEHWGRLDSQLVSVAAGGEALRQQTAELAGVLRATGGRGRWGEVQLQRVVELAGMLNHVDFELQAQGQNDDGSPVRPDLVVHLPGGRHVVVDAKAPLSEDDQAHARRLRAHVTTLTGKRYWTAFQPAPEFVVCFLPSEDLLSAACAQDGSLLEWAMDRHVVISTPTTLLALLRTVALTWQQESLVGNAKQVVQLGRELHEKLRDLAGRTAKLGRSLNSAVADYNNLVATTEKQVLERTRRLAELGASHVEPVELTPLTTRAREPLEESA